MMNKAVFKNIYPRQVWRNENCPPPKPIYPEQEDRFGGFLVPFIAGAAISAPFWFVAGNNKAQQQAPVQYQYQYQQPVQYYPYPSYPVFYRHI